MTTLLLDGAREWLGRSTSFQPWDASATDIRRFAHSIGATDPVHFDSDAARRAGYPDIVAPYAYYTVIRHGAPNLVALSDLADDGVAEDMVPPTTATRRMAGETTATFVRRIVAGDKITLTKTLSGMDEKAGRSGPLLLLTYTLRYADQDDRDVVREQFVRIMR